MEVSQDWGTRVRPGDLLAWESYSVSERICNWTLAALLLEWEPWFAEFLDAWWDPEPARYASFLAAHLETVFFFQELSGTRKSRFSGVTGRASRISPMAPVFW